MHFRNNISLYILTALLFLNCKKEELPIGPVNRGGIITSQVHMGSDYKEQIYYSLPGNSIVTSNLKVDWDLCFESSSSGYHIKLNSAKWMGAFKTIESIFENVSDTSGYKNGAEYDKPDGSLDSTAIGDWQTAASIYIIDRGYTPTGSKIGYKKMKALSFNATSFTIRYANPNGSNEQTVTIQKDQNKNFTYFSMNTNGVVTIEPDKEDYDFVFTQYTHIYYHPDYMPYLVVGVLSNPNKVKVAPIAGISFSMVSLNDTVNFPFSKHQNAIGYDWKEYNLTTNTYTVANDKSYIIKSVNGYYFKLRFIGFYSDSGLKGSPKFEFQML